MGKEDILMGKLMAVLIISLSVLLLSVSFILIQQLFI